MSYSPFPQLPNPLPHNLSPQSINPDSQAFSDRKWRWYMA